MSKHTPEPWALFEVGDGRQHLCHASESDKMSILTIAEEDGVTFACVYKDSDARRIVTCVNACAGMADPAAEIAELKRQRDELLAVLTHSRGMLGNAAMRMKWFDISKAQEILRGVDMIDKSISKSKGGAA